MPRAPRRLQPGAIYHLISRFVDRNWYITNEQERRHYLELLGRALTTSDWRCFAYAVMSNHIHLMVAAGKDPLDSWIRRVHAPFAGSMNRAYDRIGPMFVRGPKALAVESGGVGHVLAYIHNNPVRAKLVENARESTWTSHRAYVGLGGVPRWLDVCGGLTLAGFREPSAFDQWAAEPLREQFDVVHDVAVMNDVAEPTPSSGEASGDAMTADAICGLTATELGITVAQLRSRRKSRVEVLGRETVVICARRAGLKGVEVARALGVSQQAVSLIGNRGIAGDAMVLSVRVMQRLAL